MDIYHALFWGCATLCVIAELLIVRAVFRPALDTSAADVPHSSRGTEIVWSVLPIFALGAIFWAAWKVLA